MKNLKQQAREELVSKFSIAENYWKTWGTKTIVFTRQDYETIRQCLELVARDDVAEWWYGEDAESYEDWTDLISYENPLKPVYAAGAKKVEEGYAVLFPTWNNNNENVEEHQFFGTLKEAEDAIANYKAMISTGDLTTTQPSNEETK